MLAGRSGTTYLDRRRGARSQADIAVYSICGEFDRMVALEVTTEWSCAIVGVTWQKSGLERIRS